MQYPSEIHNTLLKPMFFSQLTLLSNNLVLTSYLSGIYLDSWLSWLWGGVQKTLKKKKNRQKKNIEKWKEKKRRIRESQITTIYIFGFKLLVSRKQKFKKSCSYLFYDQILFKVFTRCRILQYT